MSFRDEVAPSFRGRSAGGLAMAVACACALLVAGCSTAPDRGTGGRPGRSTGPSPGRDGPPPPGAFDPGAVRDARPRVEAIRQGGPNKPYAVAGRGYVPMTRDEPWRESGLASWYGTKFHGAMTSSGEPYDMYAMTAAHPTMPIPSYARVRNPANDREVIVRINDRGPFVPGRVIDLSYAAAHRLGVTRGVSPVEVVRLTHDDIRRGEGAPSSPAPPEPPPPDPAAQAPPPARVPEAPAEPGPSERPPSRLAGRGWWLQLGAFQDPQGAASFQARLAEMDEGLGPLLARVAERDLHKIQAGPYASRDEAARAAQRLREQFQLVPMVVERR